MIAPPSQLAIDADKTDADKRLPIGILLAAITSGIFARVLRQSFLDWDDPLHVTDNPLMHPISVAHIEQFWRHSYCGLYIPIAYMLFSALAALGRVNPPLVNNTNWVMSFDPQYFHGASLLLHTSNSLLVYLLLLRLVRKTWPSFAGALLFAIHPVQVEAVAWISEIRGLLSAFFCLSAMHLYFLATPEQRNAPVRLAWRWYIAATLCFVLAMLSKPGAVAVPLAIWAIDQWMLRVPSRVSIARLLPWVLLCLPQAVLTHNVQPMDAGSVVPIWQRPWVALDAIGFYIGKLVLPVKLATDYGRTPHLVVTHPAYLVCAAVPIVIAIIAWWNRGKRPYYLASCLIFAAILLPVLGFVPFHFQLISTVGDRYVYLAMLGPALALASLIATTPGRTVASVSIIALTALAAAVAVQVRVWDTPKPSIAMRFP